MLKRINQEEEYAQRALKFAAMSDRKLLEDYRRVHASAGIVGSKLRYLSQLNEVIESRGLPSSQHHVSLKKTMNYGNRT
jgi:hypothetical protein